MVSWDVLIFIFLIMSTLEHFSDVWGPSALLLLLYEGKAQNYAPIQAGCGQRVKVSDSLVQSWTLAVISPLLALVSMPAEGQWHPQPWGCPTLLKDTRSCSFPKKRKLQKEHGLGVRWTWYYFQAMSFGANYFTCLSLSFLIFKMGIERISLFHMAVTKIKWVKGYKAFPQSLTSKITLVNVSSPDFSPLPTRAMEECFINSNAPCGCQGGGDMGEGWIGRLGLADANYYM